MEQFDPKAMREAMRLASSPAGKQLLQLLQQSGNPDLQKAMAQATAGDYTMAKQAVAALAQSEEVQKYLKQMRREQHG